MKIDSLFLVKLCSTVMIFISKSSKLIDFNISNSVPSVSIERKSIFLGISYFVEKSLNEIVCNSYFLLFFCLYPSWISFDFESIFTVENSGLVV